MKKVKNHTKTVEERTAYEEKAIEAGECYEDLAIEAAEWFDNLDSYQAVCFARWARDTYGKDIFLEMEEEEFVKAYLAWLEPPFDI